MKRHLFPIALICLAWLAWSGGARAEVAKSGAAGKAAETADDDDDDDEADDVKKSGPNIYLDWSTVYASTPGGTFFLFGIRDFSALSGAGSKSVVFDAPLTIDLNDRVTVYAGASGTTSRSAGSPWSSLSWGSWKAGFSADIVEHKGHIPTITLKGSVSRPLAAGPLGIFTTTWMGGVELDYPFDEDETRGLLAGLEYTRIFIDTRAGKVHPVLLSYGGAYYKWADGTKLSARAGLQHFGGADLGALLQLKRVEQPFVKLDLERLDKNDNKLLGVSVAVGWSPKPAVQLTLSTPLYAVRN